MEALRPRGPARRALGRDLRVDRGPAPAGLGRRAGHLPPGAWPPRWRTPSASSCATRAGVRARAERYLDDAGGLPRLAADLGVTPPARLGRRRPPHQQIGQPQAEGEQRQAHGGARHAQRHHRAGQIERQLHRQADHEQTRPHPAGLVEHTHACAVLAPRGLGRAVELGGQVAHDRPPDQHRDRERRRVGRVEDQARAGRSSRPFRCGWPRTPPAPRPAGPRARGGASRAAPAAPPPARRPGPAPRRRTGSCPAPWRCRPPRRPGRAAPSRPCPRGPPAASITLGGGGSPVVSRDVGQADHDGGVGVVTNIT